MATDVGEVGVKTVRSRLPSATPGASVGRDNGGSTKSPSPGVGSSMKTHTLVQKKKELVTIFKMTMLDWSMQHGGSVNVASFQ